MGGSQNDVFEMNRDKQGRSNDELMKLVDTLAKHLSQDFPVNRTHIPEESLVQLARTSNSLVLQLGLSELERYRTRRALLATAGTTVSRVEEVARQVGSTGSRLDISLLFT